MNIDARLEQAQEIYQRGWSDLSKDHSVEHYLMKIIGSLAEADKAHEQGRDVNKEYNNGDSRFETYDKEVKEYVFSKSLYAVLIFNTWQDKLADVYIGLVGLAMHYFFKNGGVLMHDIFLDEDFTLRQLDIDKNLSFSERCFDLVKTLGSATMNDIFSVNTMNLAFELQQYFPAFDLDWHVAEKMKYLQTKEN